MFSLKAEAKKYNGRAALKRCLLSYPITFLLLTQKPKAQVNLTYCGTAQSDSQAINMLLKSINKLVN